MDVLMRKCRDCKRLIASDATRLLCDVCFAQYDLDLGLVEDAIHVHGQSKPSQIAAHTHLPIQRVEALLHHAKVLAENVESETVCSSCHESNALAHSPYCLRCQLAIYKSLGDEAHQAEVNLISLPDTNLPSLRDTLAEKRQRTGTSRFQNSPKSVKGR